MSATATFRVSEVESYRQFVADPDGDLESLLAWIGGANVPSPAMAAGTAFHRALELANDGEYPTLEAMGYTFDVDADIEIALPEIREFRCSKRYGSLNVSGQVDALEGLRVEDHKTTARFDPDRYLSGYQWRYYLDIFGAKVFRWNVFELKAIDERKYKVVGHHTLEQCAYIGMADDCKRLAADLEEFARFYMPERFARQAA